jgi:hypothetical protein
MRWVELIQQRKVRNVISIIITQSFKLFFIVYYIKGEPEAAIYGYGAIRFLATANLNTLSKKTENVEGKTIKISKQKSLAYRLVKVNKYLFQCSFFFKIIHKKFF